MSEEIKAFANIAPFLTNPYVLAGLVVVVVGMVVGHDRLIKAVEHIVSLLTKPLVLVGLVVMLGFGAYHELLKAKIIPTLTQEQGGLVAILLLQYGFIIGALVVLLGFGLEAYKTHKKHKLSAAEISANIAATAAIAADTTSANIAAIVKTLTEQHQRDNEKHQQDKQADQEEIKSLTATITELRTGQGIDASQAELDAAYAALAQGKTALAKNLFARTAEKAEQSAQRGAAALRNLGALAYLDSTQEALQAYRRAVQLDPDNADGWNRLGHLLSRIGALDEAIDAYRKVLKLGEQHNKLLPPTAI